MGTSTFAEYTVMPEIALAKVNPEADFDAICLLACGATTGIAAALWKAEVEEGSSVAVFGAGMVGLGAVAGAKLRGAEKILVVDPSAERLELARRFGATHTLTGGADAVEQVLAETGGFGADYTFEATGLVEVMGQAVEAARMGWGLCTVLGVAGKGEKLEIIPRFLITGRRVQGGSFGGARGRTHVPQLVDMYLEGRLDLDGFVSHRLTLDEVNKGFDLMHHQDGIRSVIQFA
jgi:S-(hydroxymethyl)glutathione dehydrogenase/alcohol dehydrogenase